MDEYTPEIGDIVSNPQWNNSVHGTSILVTAIGRDKFLAVDSNGQEYAHSLESKWVKIGPPKPLPNRYINIHESGVGQSCKSREEADVFSDQARIAVLYIETNEHGEDILRLDRI